MSLHAPDWGRALEQAEEMVVLSAGREPERSGSAGREPEPTPPASVQPTAEQDWLASGMCKALRHHYSEQFLTTEYLASYVLPPNADLHRVKENAIEWMSLAHRMGKVVSSHFRWTDLTAALEYAGPTPHIFQNLARAVSKYPGLRATAQNLVGAAGDRVQSVRASGVDMFMRHGDMSNLMIVSDSTLNFGQNRAKTKTYTPEQEMLQLCQQKGLQMHNFIMEIGAHTTHLAERIVSTLCQKFCREKPEEKATEFLEDPEKMPLT